LLPFLGNLPKKVQRGKKNAGGQKEGEERGKKLNVNEKINTDLSLDHCD